MSDLKMHTANLVAKNIEKLTALFPNCVTEGRNEQGEIVKGVDFELLRQELSNVLIDGEQERYTLNWVGKKESILAANAPIAKTLRPCREESVNFDTTENLFIEGDNLDALKLLQENYLGKVKMIYIDPPYNTGNDFIYDDDFAENIEEFLIRSNQIDEDGNRLIANTESNGRFHSDWLSMMYSRLRLARNLLRDDGVIFISIDNNEQSQLKLLCDEVFGKNNFIDILIIARSANGMGSKEGYSTNHDFILVYKRSNTENIFLGLTPSNEYLAKFNKEDKFGKYKIDGIFRKKGQGARKEDSPGCFYPIYYNSATNEVSLTKKNNFIEIFPKLPDGNDGRWIWSKSFAEDKVYRLYASNNGTIYVKDYWSDDLRQKPRSILNDSKYLTDTATNELLDLFNQKIFSTPKPTKLIYDLIDNSVKKDEIILDFFVGSGTTAHSVMRINAKDNGSRKFICVQLPEKTDEKSDAFKAGFTNIAEISKERIRRAGAKIQAENTDKQIDIGFRVLKIDSSNMKDIYYQPDQLDKTMLDHMVSHIKEDRSAEDLLFQVMLDWGIELSLPIERKTIDGSEVYFVAGNTLVACFDKFTMNVVDEIAKVKPLRVVSTELAIMHDQDKTNIKERFKQLSPDTEVKFL